MNKAYLIIIAIIILCFGTAMYLLPQMPDKMASHWNAQGQVDGYMSKFRALFLMPIVCLAMLLFFWLIPKIDPLKANIEKFRKYFDRLIVIIVLFLGYIYVLSLAWNLGYEFNMTYMMAPALGILYYYCGVLMQNAKRNWFIGIRTPWTLSSDIVWEKTHSLGAKMFKISGLIALLGILFGKYAIWLAVIPAVIASIYTLFYSYFEFQKLKN